MGELKDVRPGCELSDEELEAASGGTQEEIDELKALLGTDDDGLGEALKKVGIDGYMLGNSYWFNNLYFDSSRPGETITHAEVKARIAIYKSMHPFG